MTIQSPERELPRNFRGGADAWDSQAGSIVLAEYLAPGITSVSADLSLAYPVLTTVQQNQALVYVVNNRRLYFVAGPSAGWVDPSAAEVKAGQLAGGGAAPYSGNTVANSVASPFDWPSIISGVATGTYRIAYVWSDGVIDSNVDVSADFVVGVATTPVSATLDLSWVARSGVQQPLALSYAVKNAVQSERGVCWPVKT